MLLLICNVLALRQLSARSKEVEWKRLLLLLRFCFPELPFLHAGRKSAVLLPFFCGDKQDIRSVKDKPFYWQSSVEKSAVSRACLSTAAVLWLRGGGDGDHAVATRGFHVITHDGAQPSSLHSLRP